MSDPGNPASQDDDLILRRFDERLTDEEFATFDERLRTDADFRERYVRMADLNACLYDEFSEISGPPSTIETAPSKAISLKRIAWFCLAAAIASIALAILPFRRPSDSPPIAAPISGPNATDPSIAADPATRPLFTPDDGRRSPEAAVLVLAEGHPAVELAAGYRFQPGVLKIDSGYVQLEFISGAVVGVSGPAEFRIESKSAATIYYGAVSAHVPERARGFVLNTPSAAVVDLGTEFSVEITESGDTQVAVLKGEVELSLLGDDGSTLLSERVNDSRAVHVDKELLQLTEMTRSADSPPVLREIAETPLAVQEEYVRSVLENKPLIYWRFEDQDQQRVSNTAGDQWNAIVRHADGEPDGIRIANGNARFRRTNHSRFLHIEESLPDLNVGDYTIELWIRPDDLSHSTCLGIFPESEPDARTHLNVIEIATETFLIHEPGAIRFLHRNPPEQQWKLGTNAFSKGICTPHQWQHIVAVKQSASMALYYNGQLARRVDLSDANGPGSYRLLVGQLNPASNWRQYSGAMDELALYPVSLTDEQVALHYRLIMEK